MPNPPIHDPDAIVPIPHQETTNRRNLSWVESLAQFDVPHTPINPHWPQDFSRISRRVANPSRVSDFMQVVSLTGRLPLRNMSNSSTKQLFTLHNKHHY